MSQHPHHECADCGTPLDGACLWERDDEAGGAGVCTTEPQDVRCESCEHLQLLERVAVFNAAKATAITEARRG